MRPIGWVRSPVKEVGDNRWGGVASIIELDENVFSSESLVGLEHFSHMEVIFWLDRVPEKNILIGSKHPRERCDWPRVGIFAQRAKDRPNRIGLSACRIIKVERTRVTVSELDAVDSTPVLDIKPFFAEFGPRSPVFQPGWTHELMRDYFAEGNG
jgi:tRNA (adenine37-N6)-methyltransferase